MVKRGDTSLVEWTQSLFRGSLWTFKSYNLPLHHLCTLQPLCALTSNITGLKAWPLCDSRRRLSNHIFDFFLLTPSQNTTTLFSLLPSELYHRKCSLCPIQTSQCPQTYSKIHHRHSSKSTWGWKGMSMNLQGTMLQQYMASIVPMMVQLHSLFCYISVRLRGGLALNADSN